MRMRVLMGMTALAFTGACAHGSTRSDTVTDEVLARVPANHMSDVNQARVDVGKAQDALAREKLRLEQAKKYVDVANSEVKISKDQLDRNQAALSAADESRNAQATTQAQSAMGLARQREQAANAHLKAANDLVNYAQERVTAAQKAVDLANARLELAKYKAVQASGDKAVANIDGDAIQKRVENSRVALEQERNTLTQAKATAGASRRSWVTLRDQLPADQRFGVGGSGTGSAANLSGQNGSNQTSAGQENYDIDARHRSTDPGAYDDKELFNLL